MKVKNEVDKLTWRVVYFTLWIKVVIFVVFGTCVVQSFSQPPPLFITVRRVHIHLEATPTNYIEAFLI